MPTLDLSSFSLALAALRRALARSDAAPDDEELRDACIQRFEFTFELAWKSMKRRLELDLPSRDEIDTLSFRGLIRVAAENGLIDDPTRWFAYRDHRNLSSHTYDAAKAAMVRAALPGFAADAQDLLDRLKRRGQEDD
jgi:nucleotidyltransferase substrate binding protein (TIGR01987 family)